MRQSRRRAADTLPNGCGDCEARVEAARIIGASNEAIADAIRHAVDTFKPVSDAVMDGTHRLDLLCKWLKTKGLYLAVGAPWVFWLMGIMSPEAAKAFSNAIKIFGG